MKIKDFIIGMRFKCSGQPDTWVITDIGKRCIVAYNHTKWLKSDKADICWDEKDNIVFYPYEFDAIELIN